jgi:N-acetylglucosaminyl-diphospho-decaprenol L-rhamnosyltransferase
VISVIIPTRNTRDLTLRCLATLAASTEVPAEIFLVDDGGRDGTSDAVRAAYPHTCILEHHDSRGFTASINAAWPLASGDIVLLLNSDTEIGRDALAHIAAAFARDERLGVAGATLRHPAADGEKGQRQWSAGREPTPLWLFVMASGLSSTLGRLPGWRRVRPESQATGDGEAAWVPATAMAIRREVTTAIGLFDPDFALYAQDLDYCLRARAAGWRIAQLHDVDVVHIGGATIMGRTRPAAAAAGAAASGLRQDPIALFGDLARWLRKERRGTWALRAGCRVRVVARQLLRFRYRGAAREAWDRETDRYRAALIAIDAC